jgi:tetratricopeptide (TPR) repeat protein
MARYFAFIAKQFKQKLMVTFKLLKTYMNKVLALILSHINICLITFPLISLSSAVVQASPEYVYGWSSLGNVLTSEGNLDQALLCYRKAISLKPSKNDLSTIILNKASIELSTGKTEEALK